MTGKRNVKQSKMARTLPVRQRTPSGAIVEEPWFLRVVTSRDVSAIDALEPLEEAVLAIGRAVGDGELQLDDPTLSRRHATFRLSPTGVEVRDEGSANGVMVGGAVVQVAQLKAGDVVRLGDTVILVCRGDRQEESRDNLGIYGRSPAIARVRRGVRRVAVSTLSVVVTGPTGTGKEVVAQALHHHSGRDGEFIAVNCPALPGTLVESTLFGHRKGAFTHATSDQKGAFVQADGGTLFLDEIGDMPIELQPKLLRALESGEVTPVGAARGRPVDARVVVATNVDLANAIDSGHFRQDLYARLAGVRIELPPLAARKDDIPLLFQHFLTPQLRLTPMSANFAERLMLWHWPRNVRELRKLAKRLAVLHADADEWQEEMLETEMLTELPSMAAAPAAPQPKRFPKPDRDELQQLLDEHSGNVSELARHVGRSRKQVYRWIQEHGLRRGDDS